MKKNIEFLKNYLDKVVPIESFQRLGTVFNTRETLYFYDTGTGKIISCDEIEYEILKTLISGNELNDKDFEIYDEMALETAIDNICDMIETEHILNAPIYKAFARETDEELVAITTHSFQSLILELTQKCNYRCKYCIYHDYNTAYRYFTSEDMTWEVAKKAIDYANDNCDKSMSVSFYGGEPLLRYDLMQKSIEYSKEVMAGKEVVFTFTTNLSLMTKDKAEYFAKEGCIILCSVDGPENIHDAYRVGADGKGTFDKTLEGLKNLVEAYPIENMEKISINIVICPPYTNEKLDAIKKFFDDIEWLPKEVVKQFSYVEEGSLKEEDINYSHFEDDREGIMNREFKAVSPINAWALENIIDGDDSTNFSYEFNRDSLIKVHKRLIADYPYQLIRRNGCCLPGGRRIYVQTDGTFTVCERVGNCPDLGNVDTGLNLEKMKKYYLEEYEDNSIEDCSTCWAVNMCTTCYASCYKEGGIDMEQKKKICEVQKSMVKGDLVMYHQILESAPEKLAKFEQMTLS